MNPDKQNFLKQKNVEASIEQQELSPEQRKDLSNAWIEMVVDNTTMPENIKDMEQSEIKKWLFSSLMEDTEKLSKEFGLEADVGLVKEIRNADSTEEKSVLELEYIKKVHEQVDRIVQHFDRSGNRSIKWNSWPKIIRETKEFNCVGATLLGINMLNKGGIKAYYGNPHGHALNITKLSNNEWWYVDFYSGKRNIIKIEPKEEIIADVSVLKIQDPKINYRLIPIYNNTEVVSSIFGNLATLKREAEDDKIFDGDIEKKEAKVYLQNNNRNFNRVDFSLLNQSLYPSSIKIDDTTEMKKEIARIDNMKSFEKSIQDYTKVLTNEQRISLVEEMKIKKDIVEKILHQENLHIIQKCSPELKIVLRLMLDKLKKVKNTKPEVYKEARDKIMVRIRNL